MVASFDKSSMSGTALGMDSGSGAGMTEGGWGLDTPHPSNLEYRAN